MGETKQIRLGFGIGIGGAIATGIAWSIWCLAAPLTLQACYEVAENHGCECDTTDNPLPYVSCGDRDAFAYDTEMKNLANSWMWTKGGLYFGIPILAFLLAGAAILFAKKCQTSCAKQQEEKRPMLSA